MSTAKFLLNLVLIFSRRVVEIDSMAFIATRTGDFRQQEIVRASPAIAPQYNDLSAQIAALETSNAASDLEISEEEQEIGEATRRIRYVYIKSLTYIWN